MRRSLLRVGCFLAAIVVAISIASAQDDGQRKKGLLQQIESSLKGEGEKRPEWKFVGPNSNNVVKFEPEGLRIKLPTGTPKERPNTGLSTGVHIKGDFEISASYEILDEQESVEKGAKSTAVQLIVNVEDPPNTRAVVARRVHAKGGMQFSTWSNLQPFKLFPATTPTGRLRIVRTGDTITFSRSEEGDGKFMMLSTDKFTASDVVDVKLACTTGGADAKIDARFTDLRIRGANLSNTKAAKLPEPAAPEEAAPPEAAVPQPASSSSSWLIVFLIGGIALLVFFVTAVGLTILLLKRRPNQEKAAAANGDGVFACSECGKSLKVKGGMAGKQVKCPHCGNKVLAPV